MNLHIAINSGLGKELKDMPSMLTEEKRIMPNDNSWKEECIEHIKQAQHCVKQYSQEDGKTVDTYLQMALDALSGEDEKKEDEELEAMKKTKDRKKMPYETEGETEDE